EFRRVLFRSSSLLLASPLPIVVRTGFQAETQQNITILPDRSNEMIINVTAWLDSGSPSSINFKLFTGSQMSSCTNDTNPSGCLVKDRKSTRLNSSHEWISYAVFCLKKKKKK